MLRQAALPLPAVRKVGRRLDLSAILFNHVTFERAASLTERKTRIEVAPPKWRPVLLRGECRDREASHALPGRIRKQMVELEKAGRTPEELEKEFGFSGAGKVKA